MIILYLLIISIAVIFTFLPQFITITGFSLSDPTDPISVTLRSLTNFRFLIIAKFQTVFIGPKYVGKIDKIHVFPIKSVSYIAPPKWTIDEHGLKHDRQYMFAFWDDKAQLYQPYTQRNAPRLSLVKIDYNLEEGWFSFTYPIDESNTTYDCFKLPMNISEEFIQDNAISDNKLKTDLWGVKFQSLNIGEAVPLKFYESMHLTRSGSTLLTSLGKKVRSAHPKGYLKEMKEVLFQDYYPIHLISQKLIDELNQRVQDSGSTRRVEALQFRPNLVIGDQQIDMDYWFDIRINNHQLFVVQKTPRCNIGNVILSQGEFDKTNIVTRTLRNYRRIDPGDVNGSFLGNYAIHKDFGYEVKIGDEIYLAQQRLSSYEVLT